MVTGLVPPEVLAILQTESAFQFDSEVDWFSVRATDGHGDPVSEAGPTRLPARVVKMIEEFYDAQGQRHVSVMRVYLPLGTAVTVRDQLVPVGDEAKKPAPILEVANVPTIGAPILLRVRTGAA